MQRSSSGQVSIEFARSEFVLLKGFSFASHAKNEVWYDLQLVSWITFVNTESIPTKTIKCVCVLCQKTKFIDSVLKLV